MAPRITAEVEPSVLRWARETIDLSASEAAERIGITEERIGDWEAGAAQPSLAQLRKAAGVYRRPLGAFFLPRPPSAWDAATGTADFRSRGARSMAWSAELHAEHRRAVRQRECWLELDRLDEVPTPTLWRADANEADEEEVAAATRTRLLESSPVLLPRGTGTPYEHLNAWVAAIEETGVLVLNTRRGAVSLDEMRVASLSFDVVPVIVVNGKDGPRNRLFSLLHAFVHLALGTGGLCDVMTDPVPTTEERRTEAKCNRIAAAMVMPDDAVVARAEVKANRADESAWDYETLRDVAAPFGTSADRFLGRLADLGLVSADHYFAERASLLAAEQAEASSGRSSGGNWYRTTARDLGKGFVRRVADAHQRQVINSYTAASFLGVKAGQVSRLADQVPPRR